MRAISICKQGRIVSYPQAQLGAIPWRHRHVSTDGQFPGFPPIAPCDDPGKVNMARFLARLSLSRMYPRDSLCSCPHFSGFRLEIWSLSSALESPSASLSSLTIKVTLSELQLGCGCSSTTDGERDIVFCEDETEELRLGAGDGDRSVLVSVFGVVGSAFFFGTLLGSVSGLIGIGSGLGIW